jgi:hypothetical protein
MKRSDLLPLLVLLGVLACSTASISRSTSASSRRPDLLNVQPRSSNKAVEGGRFLTASSDESGMWLSGGPPGSCTSNRFGWVEISTIALLALLPCFHTKLDHSTFNLLFVPSDLGCTGKVQWLVTVPLPQAAVQSRRGGAAGASRSNDGRTSAAPTMCFCRSEHQLPSAHRENFII